MVRNQTTFFKVCGCGQVFLSARQLLFLPFCFKKYLNKRPVGSLQQPSFSGACSSPSPASITLLFHCQLHPPITGPTAPLHPRGTWRGAEGGVAAWELNTTALNSLGEENISQFLPEFLWQLQRGQAAFRGADENSIASPEHRQAPAAIGQEVRKRKYF